MTSTGFELATLGFEVRYTLSLSYGALHARENIIVDFELGVGLKLDNFHSFTNSAMQSSVGISLQIQGSSVRTTVLQIFSNVNIITTSVKIVVKWLRLHKILTNVVKFDRINLTV